VLLSLFALILRLRQMWVVPLFGIACLVAARAATIHHSGLAEAALREKMYYPIHTHADALAVGLFLAWISVYHPKRLRSAWFAATSSSAMLVLGLAVYVSSRLLFNFTALGLIYGAFVMYGVSVLPFPSVLRWRGFYVTGRLSFGFYLNHFGMLSRLHPILIGWRTRGGEFGFWGCYLLLLAGCLVVAALTFQLIEWPFLRIRSIWLDRGKSRAVAASAS
jgi:peptidoglycan/LPS O-acetylase OafA/YrhL